MKTSGQVMLLLVFLPALALAGKGPFSLTIAPPPESFKLGDELVLQITVKNTSGGPIGFARTGDVTPEEGARYKVEVWGPDGHLVPRTPSPIQKEKPTVNMMISNVSHTLQPGESFVDRITVTKYFDLSRPGKYSILVERPLEPWQKIGSGFIRSNKVTVMVTRDPAQ
jgi:hypothetical protein